MRNIDARNIDPQYYRLGVSALVGNIDFAGGRTIAYAVRRATFVLIYDLLPSNIA